MNTKVCTKCGVDKPIEDFHRDKTASGGHSRRCKVCAIKHVSAWARNNKARVNAKNAKWKSEHKSNVLKAAALYREKNREECRRRIQDCKDRNRDAVRAYGRAYIRLNKVRANEIWHKRRARLMEATVEDVRREDVWSRDNGVCHICGEECDHGSWHLDHVVALANGGEHSMINVAVSHPLCNQRKGTKNIESLRCN